MNASEERNNPSPSDTTDLTLLASKKILCCYGNWTVHTVSDESKPRSEIPTISGTVQ